MEFIECPLYEECKEYECEYFKDEDCSYEVKEEEDSE